MFVYCKYPMGLAFNVNGKEVVFYGPNKASKKTAEGYGITEVSKEIWEHITTQYKEYTPIKNGVLFARENENAGLKESESMHKEHKNLDPIDYDNPDIAGLGTGAIEPTESLKSIKSKIRA